LAAKLLVGGSSSLGLGLVLGASLVGGSVALANIEGANLAATFRSDEHLHALATLGHAGLVDPNVGGASFCFVVLDDGGSCGASVFCLGLGGSVGIGGSTDDEEKGKSDGELTGVCCWWCLLSVLLLVAKRALLESVLLIPSRARVLPIANAAVIFVIIQS
jgi:hypothetical protein